MQSGRSSPKLSREMVRHIARLARIKLEPEEEELFSRQLDDILVYMEKLEKLDTTKVEPMFHVVPLQNVTQEDVTRPSLDREAVLKGAPRTARGCFRVPEIIE